MGATEGESQRRVVVKGKDPGRRPARQDDGVERDERGLTDYDKWRGRQMLCHVCHGRPCADSCPEQWMPDRLEWKAARAGLPIGEWARIHGEWTRAHAERPDVAAWLEGQTRPLEGAGERRIPVEVAMAQAMAVVAGEARAEDVAPVYAAAVAAHGAEETNDEATM